MNIFEFIKETDGLENSLNFAIKLGLLPNKNPKDCIKCGRTNGLRWTINNRSPKLPFMFVCAERTCRVTVKLGKNSLFDQTAYSLSNSLRLIYFWLLKISIKDCANQLELTESSVVEWFQLFREVCAFVIINYTAAIGGPGHVIDLCDYQLQTKDESYDLWIFTGIDRNRGNNFAVHVEDLDCETIWPVIKNYILPGSIVVTPRFKEFVNKENGSEERLVFVHPDNYPRRYGDMQLDDMFNDMKEFVHKEMSPSQPNCIELYAYQYLYFKRDTFSDKPASELILPFLNDVKQVYPGFDKEKQLALLYKMKNAK